MKALSLIAGVFSVFLIYLGSTSKKTAGDVLGNALIIGGVLIAVFLISVWITLYLKKKKENGF